MAGANRSFSKFALGAGAAISLLAVAGCSGQGGLLQDGLRRSTLLDAQPVAAAAPADAGQKPVMLRPALDTAQTPAKPAALVVQPASGSPEPVVADEPAWCTYLREDTAAQTTIMRSPSLSGSLQDDGKSSVSLGLSLTDIGKASAVDRTADARCRKYMAETGLQKLVFLSPQGLTSAGFKAKAQTILARRADVQRWRSEANRLLNSGDISRERATALTGMADTLLAAAHEAQSNADRRTGDFLGAKDRASVLGRELLRAEADLEDLNNTIRSYDAVDVSLSAGWMDDLTQDSFASTEPDFRGKVSVSVKLGALAPSRFAHQEKAKAAKLRAIKDEEGGALWQVNVLRLAHERAISGLEQSRRQLDQALADAERLLGVLNNTHNPEYAGNVISAKLQILGLRADRAAVAGSIDEIRNNLKRLQTAG